MRASKLGVASGLMFALAAAPGASAAITPVWVSQGPEGPFFRWTYEASIGGGLRVQQNDFFTLYDIGSVADVQTPAGWDFSTALEGQTALLMLPDDDPAISNLTFRFAGTAPIIGLQDLGTFSFLSASDLLSGDFFTGQATRNGGVEDGEFVSNVGQLPLPGPVGGEIPEPSALSLVALVGLPLLGRRRRTAGW